MATDSKSNDGAAAGKLIERVASEFNQLQFYVTQSVTTSAFLDDIGPRISKITLTLQKGLKRLFTCGLKSSDSEVLRQCLRTYAIIDRIKDVEELFREMVVAPFVASHIVGGSAETLPALYEGILTFVAENCGKLADAAKAANVTGVDFVVNAVWPEVSDALSKLKYIFASGNAEDFHSNYTATEKFISEFEVACGTILSVQRLRVHPLFITFKKRWSLPVYFQLRFQVKHNTPLSLPCTRVYFCR